MDKFVPLNENKDFRRIYAKGKSYVSSSVITYVSKNRCKQIRVGITTSKKIGNAVQRNKSSQINKGVCSPFDRRYQRRL